MDSDTLLLTGARIWAPGGAAVPVDSVAVAGGRIVALGPADRLRRMAGRSGRCIDLAGRVLLPGFVDAHCHPIMAGLDRLRCDLSEDGEDVDAYLDTIAAYAATDAGGGWVTGSGWSMGAFPQGRPSRQLLDRVLPDRPALLYSQDGHSGWVNSAALRLAGIDRETPDPPSGRIERDPDGSPQGTLQERATELVDRLLPPVTAVEREKGLLLAQDYLHGLGVTSWNEANVDQEAQAAYVALESRGLLTGRASLSLRWDDLRGTEQLADLEARRTAISGLGSPRLRAEDVKIFQDGVMESRTAALLEPYLDPAGRPGSDVGMRMHDPETLQDAVTALHASGFAIHAHAIGDRAVRDVLDAIEAAIRSSGVRHGRHHIAHLQLVDAADIPRFASLGVFANAQPLWAAEDSYLRDLTRPIVGDARTDRMYPFASLRRAGARLAIGSDWNVTTADPLQIMEVAVRRIAPERPADRPFVPSERLALDEALEAYTAGSAAVCGFAGAGSIAVGASADMVALDGDLLSGTGRPTESRVVLTVAGGRIVHEDPLLG